MRSCQSMIAKPSQKLNYLDFIIGDMGDMQVQLSTSTGAGYDYPRGY